MTDTTSLVERLRSRGGVDGKVAGLLDEAAAELTRLQAENANLKTVMIAAAEEIQAHWQAHCDAEGYGPANLMHRLETGIPSEYGYTAGRFAELQAELDAARVDAQRYRFIRDTPWDDLPSLRSIITLQKNALWDVAIDAAIKETKA